MNFVKSTLQNRVPELFGGVWNLKFGALAFFTSLRRSISRLKQSPASDLKKFYSSSPPALSQGEGAERKNKYR